MQDIHLAESGILALPAFCLGTLTRLYIETDLALVLISRPHSHDPQQLEAVHQTIDSLLLFLSLNPRLYSLVGAIVESHDVMFICTAHFHCTPYTGSSSSIDDGCTREYLHNPSRRHL